uniref:Methyltransferase type 11 domain-containing protein n=1 Tax=Calcidiscus leptoporus TaxID=127549 RepID=A0A7S0IVY5_9EUKA
MAVYAAGVVVTYEVITPKPPLPTASTRCCTFSSLAPNYDAEVERDEQRSGIVNMRRDLVQRAEGRVLEVAAGTGRNLPFYSAALVKELFIGDFCEGMLQVTAQKLAKLRTTAAGDDCPSKVTLAVLDAAALPFADGAYDTVVDSFGLCSFEDPEMALKEMARCCRPGGQVLLLEHGASWLPPLRWWQRHRLNRHVQRYGCYWDRDIMSLVKGSGLKVIEVKQYHLGTTHVIHCAPQVLDGGLD